MMKDLGLVGGSRHRRGRARRGGGLLRPGLPHLRSPAPGLPLQAPRPRSGGLPRRRPPVPRPPDLQRWPPVGESLRCSLRPPPRANTTRPRPPRPLRKWCRRSGCPTTASASGWARTTPPSCRHGPQLPRLTAALPCRRLQQRPAGGAGGGRNAHGPQQLVHENAAMGPLHVVSRRPARPSLPAAAGDQPQCGLPTFPDGADVRIVLACGAAQRSR